MELRTSYFAIKPGKQARSPPFPHEISLRATFYRTVPYLTSYTITLLTWRRVNDMPVKYLLEVKASGTRR